MRVHGVGRILTFNTQDPIIISDGNMQIHVSSCDGPDFVTLTGELPPSAMMAPATGNDVPSSLWFANGSPWRSARLLLGM